jgi:hypothetical protein
MAGALSGVIATLVTYPMDVIKTRLTVGLTDPSKAYYKGMRHAFVRIRKEEGLSALYKGLTPSILGKFIFNFSIAIMEYKLLL